MNNATSCSYFLFDLNHIFQTTKNGFNFPSPDSSVNHFVPGFGTKDWNV